MPTHTTETVAEHSARLQPSINLHALVTAFYVQLLWYPMYYPRGTKAWVSPMQWSMPYSMLALPPLRIRTRSAGFKITSGDQYTTTALGFNPKKIKLVECWPWIHRKYEKHVSITQYTHHLQLGWYFCRLGKCEEMWIRPVQLSSDSKRHWSGKK